MASPAHNASPSCLTRWQRPCRLTLAPCPWIPVHATCLPIAPQPFYLFSPHNHQSSGPCVPRAVCHSCPAHVTAHTSCAPSVTPTLPCLPYHRHQPLPLPCLPLHPLLARRPHWTGNAHAPRPNPNPNPHFVGPEHEPLSPRFQTTRTQSTPPIPRTSPPSKGPSSALSPIAPNNDPANGVGGRSLPFSDT